MLPFFHIKDYFGEQRIVLDENTSRHVVQVLRMNQGELLNLTDGKGKMLTCIIEEAHKKHCLVQVHETRSRAQNKKKISIGISLLKNPGRFEWFLEKATEIGVAEIIPLICVRTEKEKFRLDRMEAVCISAMLQSQQCWLPVLREPRSFNLETIQQFSQPNKFIAHCIDAEKKQLDKGPINSSTIILIGPEGDFTAEEISMALDSDFHPVSLGDTRLRSETAGIVAATLLQLA